MASFHPSSTCEYFSSDCIGQGVFMNTIAYMNLLLPQKSWFTVGEDSDLHWPWDLECTCLHQNSVAGAPGKMVHGKCHIIWWEGLTFQIWAMVVALPKVDFGNLEVEGMQCHHQHDFMTVTINPFSFLLTFLDRCGQYLRSRGVDPN